MATWTVHQSIVIHQMKIGAVNNSSVLQIGTAGSIRSLANLYNTGGFTGPAPELGQSAEEPSPLPLVPLPVPST
ncbi:spore germination protein PB [Paenibacillus sp. UNCCL117]|uniref:spore germination protein GerPB n=1 Tax=unclassified Paenibacillus TaxID=185978 RepID=UPI00088347F3|nr:MULTISPECIES: spore germination protein GerPB [unclassified Paenibacillus]SDC77207.1 spore germination protein PB [Paenibacillus sp. cl123]SFW25770.1 spore germination protein PB [Paenibacillus sp. UNCCL117]